jgi:hypothetical protein
MQAATSELGRCSLISVGSGLALDGRTGTLQLQPATGSTTQQWRVAEYPGTGNAGWYGVVSYANKQLVDVQNASTQAGASLVLRPLNGKADQMWRADPELWFANLENRHSGQVMTVPNGGRSPGAPVVQMPAVPPDPFQVWLPLSPNPMAFASSNTNLLLGTYRDQIEPGVPLIQTTYANQQDLKWLIVPLTGDDLGYVVIMMLGTNLVVDVANGSTAPGASLQLSRWVPSNSQKWQLLPNDLGDPSIVLVQNKNSELVITVPGGAVDPGVRLVQERTTRADPKTQSWMIQQWATLAERQAAGAELAVPV